MHVYVYIMVIVNTCRVTWLPSLQAPDISAQFPPRTANSGAAKGLTFSQLSEDQQEFFYSYTVAVDVIRNAEKSEIL